MVLAGAWLAFVAIDEDVFWLGGLFGDKRPFHAGRESCPTSAAQTAGFHLVDDPFRALRKAFFCGLIAPELEITVDVRRAKAKAPRNDLDFIWMRNQLRHAEPSLL